MNSIGGCISFIRGLPDRSWTKLLFTAFNTIQIQFETPTLAPVRLHVQFDLNTFVDQRVTIA